MPVALQAHHHRHSTHHKPSFCRRYNSLSQWASYPAYTCIIEWDYNSYSNFTGNPNSYTSITTLAGNYNTTGTLAWVWYPDAPCSTAYVIMCEVPRQQFACPTSAPPSPPPAPYNNGLCE